MLWITFSWALTLLHCALLSCHPFPLPFQFTPFSTVTCLYPRAPCLVPRVTVATLHTHVQHAKILPLLQMSQNAFPCLWQPQYQTHLTYSCLKPLALHGQLPLQTPCQLLLLCLLSGTTVLYLLPFTKSQLQTNEQRLSSLALKQYKCPGKVALWRHVNTWRVYSQPCSITTIAS